MLRFGSIPTFTSNHAKFLKRTEITEDGPGFVLRDVPTMLAALEDGGLPVSESQHAILASELPELDAQLTHSIETEYKRLQQSAFPTIAGLNLLLRASGMAQPRHVDGSLRLRIDDAVVASWRDLNRTEQYFALLEAWLNRANAKEIFDKRRGAFDGNLHPALTLVMETPPTPRGAGLDENDRDELTGYYGEPNVALMWAFGLVDLDEAGTAAGEPWRMQRISVQPFGKALLIRLANALQEKMTAKPEGEYDADWDFEGERQRLSARDLRKVLHPYFPAYERFLKQPRTEFRPDMHVFDVVLERRDESIEWRMAFPGATTLDRVSETILSAVQFDREHLYRFEYRDGFGQERVVNDPRGYLDPPFADEVRIGDLPLATGETMIYLYDFGTSWRFEMHLDAVGDPDLEEDAPAVLHASGEPPDQYPDPGAWW